MSQLIVPSELCAVLARATGPVDVVDPEGLKVGRYIPESAAVEPFCPWDPTLTPEEADRIADEPGGCRLEEIWKRLGVK